MFHFQMPHHRRVFAAFLIYSFILSGVYVRIADIQEALGVSKAMLGLGLLAAPLGTQLALVLAGGLIERLGQRNTVLAGLPALALFTIGAASAPTLVWFAFFMFLAGLLVGGLEIVLNLEADRAEHFLGRRVMSRAHAFWSFGFFGSGILGALAAQLAIAPWLHLAIVQSLAVLLLGPVFAGIVPAPAREAAGSAKPPRFVLPTKAIMVLVVITLPAMLLEGAAIDWSVIYMRETFSPSALVGGLGFVLAAGCQALTRFWADPVVDRLGPVQVSRSLLMLLGLGCLMVTFAPWVWTALIGFALIGVGSSSIFPLAMSAAAQMRDRQAAINVAALAQLSFVIFLMAPPMLGFVAEYLGIRTSFGLGLPLVVLALMYVDRLAPTKQQGKD